MRCVASSHNISCCVGACVLSRGGRWHMVEWLEGRRRPSLAGRPPGFAPPMPDPLRVQSGIDLLGRNLLLTHHPRPASSSIHQSRHHVDDTWMKYSRSLGCSRFNTRRASLPHLLLSLINLPVINPTSCLSM